MTPAIVTIKRYSSTVMWVVLCTITVLGFHRVEQEQVDRQVAECVSTNDFRTVFRHVLDQVAGPSVDEDGASAISGLTAMPSFARLPEPMQDYLRELDAALNSSASTTPSLDKIRDQFIEDFPQRDCDELRRQLEDGWF